MSVNLCVQLCQVDSICLRQPQQPEGLPMLMPTYVSRAVPKASDEESQSDRGCDCSCNITFHRHKVICFVDSRFELHPYNAGFEPLMCGHTGVGRMCRLDI